MNQKLFALWDHGDTLLGGPIRSFTDEGLAKVENYGGGCFYPVLVLPLRKGEEVLAEFEGLRAQRHRAQEKFDKEWDDKYEALKKKHGVK